MSDLPFDLPQNINPCIFPDMVRITHYGGHNTLYPKGKPCAKFVKEHVQDYRNMNIPIEQYQCVQLKKN